MKRAPVDLGVAQRENPRLHAFLSDELPRLKLRLGEEIDRANHRPLPRNYDTALSVTTLNVVLGQPLAAAVEEIAAHLEADLNESCRRHGLIYDRAYRVRVWSASTKEAPDIAIVAQTERASSAKELGPDDGKSTSTGRGFPIADPDATVLSSDSTAKWDSSKWLLRVVAREGDPETYQLSEPQVTVGRKGDNPDLAATIVLASAPRTVSRRQLALSWAPKKKNPGFSLWNLGGPEMHVEGQKVVGANSPPGVIDLSVIDDRHHAWIEPDARVEIGASGLTFWIEANAAAWDDADRTLLE